MITLWKRKLSSLPSLAEGSLPLKMTSREYTGKRMDLEFDFEEDQGLTRGCHYSGSDEDGFFAEEGSERNSPFILNPLFNDQPLLQRDQQYMFLEVVRTILREYGQPEKEIGRRLRDKNYLKRVFIYLSDQAKLHQRRNAIQAE